MFFPSNVIFNAMIVGNKANAKSDEGLIAPINKPAASAVIAFKLTNPNNCLNQPFCKVDVG